MKKICFITILALLLSVLSCELNVEDITRHVELEYITLDTSRVITDYAEGAEKLITTGLKIIGHYSDDSEKEEDLGLAKFSGFDSKKQGTVTITVEYSGKTADYAIIVGEDLPKELIISNYPEQLLYWNDDNNFNYDGLELKIRKESGIVEDLSLDDVTFELSSPYRKSLTVTVIYNKYPELSNRFNFYVFSIFDVRNMLGEYDKTLINNFSFETSGHLRVSGYKENEEIDLSGLDIDIKNTNTNQDVLSIPAERVHLLNKTVSTSVIQKDGKALIKINGKSIWIQLKIIDKYIGGASLTIENKYFENNYLGQSIDFTDGELFTFNRLFADNTKQPINFNKKNIVPYYESTPELLTYSTSKDGPYKEFGNSLKLDKLGEDKIYFKYYFYSEKIQSTDTYEFFQTFYVQDAKPDYLTADLSYKDSNKQYLPYSVTNKTLNTYISLENLKVIKTDGKEYDYPLDVSKIAFTIYPPSANSFNNGNTTAPGYIELSCYFGSDTIKGRLENVMFFKELK